MSAPASSQPPPSLALPRKGPFSKRGDTSCANVVPHLHRIHDGRRHRTTPQSWDGLQPCRPILAPSFSLTPSVAVPPSP